MVEMRFMGENIPTTAELNSYSQLHNCAFPMASANSTGVYKNGCLNI